MNARTDTDNQDIGGGDLGPAQANHRNRRRTGVGQAAVRPHRRIEEGSYLRSLEGAAFKQPPTARLGEAVEQESRRR